MTFVDSFTPTANMRFYQPFLKHERIVGVYSGGGREGGRGEGGSDKYRDKERWGRDNMEADRWIILNSVL